MVRRMSAKGRAWLIRSEGVRRTAYRDTQGHWTIGVGHLILPSEQHLLDATLTDAEIDALLVADLDRFERAVSATRTPSPLLQDQFDALVHFAFNVGVGAYNSSTLKRELEAGAPPDRLREAWMMWTANPELTGRRRKEWSVFAQAAGAVAVLLALGAGAFLMFTVAAWKP